MSEKVTRREFLKEAGLALGGAATGVASASALWALRDDFNYTPKPGGHIVQIKPEESACTGCGTCELVCAAAHGNLVGPSKRRIWLERDTPSPIYRVLSCRQCNYPACYYACPHKDRALCIDRKMGIRFINAAECIDGCRYCLEACTMEPPRINYDKESKTLLMCDLCKERAQGPACVEFCPSRCLELELPRT